MSISMLGTDAFAADILDMDEVPGIEIVEVTGETPDVQEVSDEVVIVTEVNSSPLSAAQQAFVDAVGSLDKNALLELANAFLAYSNEETGNAMDAAHLGITNAEALFLPLRQTNRPTKPLRQAMIN